MDQMHSTPAGRALAGKLAAVSLLALALLAALAAGGYYYRLQRRPLRHWGTSNAQLIVLAPRVWATRLLPLPARGGSKPTAPGQQVLMVDGRPLAVAGWKDISQARGLANIRHVFINDHAYDWAELPRRGSASWRYALRFQNGPLSCTLVFDARATLVQLLDSNKTVSMAPAAASLRAFLEEQLPPTVQSTPQTRGTKAREGRSQP